jgi:hypothetical protein
MFVVRCFLSNDDDLGSHVHESQSLVGAYQLSVMFAMDLPAVMNFAASIDFIRIISLPLLSSSSSFFKET